MPGEGLAGARPVVRRRRTSAPARLCETAPGTRARRERPGIRRRRAAAALTFACAVSAALPAPAATLVQNLDIYPQGGVSAQNRVAQRFTTGSNEHGYTLTSVKIGYGDGEGDTFSTKVCTTTTFFGTFLDQPTSTCWNLTAPSSFPATVSSRTLTFTAPNGIHLDKESNYSVVVTPDSSKVRFSLIWSGDESGDMSGWSIADEARRQLAGGTWYVLDTTKPVLRIGVYGTVRTTAVSTDAALSALAVEDEGTALSFDHPSFASTETTYYLSVANSVGVLTVAPATSDDGATVAYRDASNAAITDTHTSTDALDAALAAAANVIKVKVTAENSTTKETYTLHVARAALAPGACDATWCANLTLGVDTERGGGRIGYSALPLNGLEGGLAPATFTIAGTSCPVTQIAYNRATGVVEFALGCDLPAGDYVVAIAGEMFPFAANGSTREFGGLGSMAQTERLSSTFGDVVSVKLVDVTAPSFTSAEVPEAGTHLYLTMSEDLDLDAADLPAPGAFTVTADGAANTVTAVEMRSDVTDGLALRLARKIGLGQTVRVSYTDPTVDDDAAALQDTDGIDAASFDESVDNNSTYRATVKVDFAEPTYAFSEDAATPTVTVVARTVEDAPPTYTVSVTLQREDVAPQGRPLATGGDDVGFRSQAVTFQPGDFSAEGGVYVAPKTVTITIIDDSEVEQTEYFGLKVAKQPTTPSSVQLCTVVDCPVFVAILDAETPPAPPAKVTGVRLTPGRDRIGVVWNRPAGATGYRVERKSGSEDYDSARSQTLSGGAPASVTIAGLAVGVTYTVRVIATNSLGDGPASNEARATTRRGARLPEPVSVEVEPDGGHILVTFPSEFPYRPSPKVADFTLLADAVRVPLSAVDTCRSRVVPGVSCYSGYSPHHPNPSDKVRLYTDHYHLVKGGPGSERYRIRTGVPVTLSYAHPEVGATFENVVATNNSTHASTVPYHPFNVEAVARGAHRIDVSWSPPAFNGGRAITAYRVEASPDGSTDWAVVAETASGDVTSFRHTGLAEGTTFHYRIRGVNSLGPGAHSYLSGHIHRFDREDARATTAADSTPPELKQADADFDDRINLFFNEPLWQLESGLPRVESFTVKVDEQTVPVTRIRRRPLTSWQSLWLILDEETIKQGQVLTVSYRDPTGGDDARALQDSAGNDAASFTDQPVTNWFTLRAGEEEDEVQDAEPSTDPLTASVESAPEDHDGESGFDVRLAFSEAPETLSFRTVRDHAFTVSGGSVLKARRVAQGSNLQWEVGVEPTGEGDVTLTLDPSPECSAAHAICTEDGRRLETGLTVTVPGPEEGPAQAVLEGEFANQPTAHDGASDFEVWIGFNHPITANKRKFPQAFEVTHGRVKRARRVGGRSDLWKLTVKPAGVGAVTIVLPGGRACGSGGVPCAKTGDGEGRIPLSNSPAITVQGPAALSVADTSAREGPGETMDFTVSLDRPALRTLTVDYATRDGSAAAGEDYTATSGTLTFSLGQQSKTVPVPILDDTKDEGEETFTLVLSNPVGGRIEDGTGVGTIENDDALQRAWLARFGRTVGGQALDAIAGRLDGAGGTQVTVGGQALALDGGASPEAQAGTEAEARAETMTRWLRHDEDEALARSMGAREVLLASAFSVSAGGDVGRPRLGAWGRFATGSFEGEDRDVRLSGDVTSAFLGADVDSGRWLGGLAVGLSEGEGPFGYTGDAASNRETGAVESSLTAFYPYARLSATERLDLWAVGGFGSGTMTITEDGGMALETDIAMRMGAAGAKGAVLAPPPEGGLALSVRSDVLWVRMDSDARRASAEDGGNLAAVETDVTRLRLIVDASRAFAVGDAATLTPSLEVGLRHDGGDAETGTGVELGGRIAWAGSGVAVEAAARGLVAHEDAGYEEWGASARLSVDPGESGRGLSLTVTPTWGAPGSGTERLWGAADARGLAPGGEFEAGRRLEAEVRYGLGLARSRGVLIPFAGLSLGEDGARVWRSGARWALGSATSLALEGTRREAGASGAAPEHRVGLSFGARW